MLWFDVLLILSVTIPGTIGGIELLVAVLLLEFPLGMFLRIWQFVKYLYFIILLVKNFLSVTLHCYVWSLRLIRSFVLKPKYIILHLKNV